jgi:hypothetical protein
VDSPEGAGHRFAGPKAAQTVALLCGTLGLVFALIAEPRAAIVGLVIVGLALAAVFTMYRGELAGVFRKKRWDAHLTLPAVCVVVELGFSVYAAIQIIDQLQKKNPPQEATADQIAARVTAELKASTSDSSHEHINNNVPAARAPRIAQQMSEAAPQRTQVKPQQDQVSVAQPVSFGPVTIKCAPSPLPAVGSDKEPLVMVEFPPFRKGGRIFAVTITAPPTEGPLNLDFKTPVTVERCRIGNYGNSPIIGLTPRLSVDYLSIKTTNNGLASGGLLDHAEFPIASFDLLPQTEAAQTFYLVSISNVLIDVKVLPQATMIDKSGLTQPTIISTDQPNIYEFIWPKDAKPTP